MSLEPVASLMADARKREYGVGYFESWNLESLQGVLDAAESVEAPVIIGFNGEFMSHSGRLAVERLELYAALGRAAAESSTVPCALIFNECPHDSWVLAAANSGFNLVMLADQTATYEDYLVRVKRIVEHSHRRGVAVEAELDTLPSGASGVVEGISTLTDPELAERFVRESGVDLLAVSVGNVHIRTEGDQPLNLDHLAVLRDRVPVPLVLHGGSGITADSIREAVRLGVAKVNYGTYLKQSCLAAMRVALASDENNPHELLGMGESRDVMVAVRFAARDAVLQRIDGLGCSGRARDWQSRKSRDQALDEKGGRVS
jgi:ketose-bisphosphate aldolase